MSIKRDNFKRISEARFARMIQLYGQIANLSNLSYYEYDKEDIDVLFNALEEASNKAKATLLSAFERKGTRRRL